MPEEYKNIIYFKFGKDLKHHNRLLSMNKERKFYNEILPKITEILERLYPHNKIEPNNKVNSKTFEILLNLFKMYPFNELITEISYDRLLIGLLESGYVDGIKYTDETVANFLGIDKAEVCILNIEFKKRVYTNSLLSDIIENRDKYLKQAKESSTNNLTKRQ